MRLFPLVISSSTFILIQDAVFASSKCLEEMAVIQLA